MKSYQELFAELKRRHVFRVAAIYGATAFGLMQLADLLVEALKLPPDFLTMITVLLLLGFPVALIMAWAFEMTPEGVRRTDAATSQEIEQLVAEPASKRWPAGFLALAGVAALIAGAWWAGARSASRGGEGSTAAEARADSLRLTVGADANDDERPSIAVLPFADMSPEGDQLYFSDGMTEEILNTLARIRDLKVAARTSAFAFRDQDMDMRAIGDSLDVAYLIEGSVRKSGDQLRITAQLINAADGTHLWSESYDRTMDDVFTIQTEIATAIAEALRVPLGIDDARDLVTPTGDLEAYDLYLAGRARIRGRGAGLRDARRLFEAAIARDSAWAPAWAGLAEASELSIWYDPSWDVEPSNLDEEYAYIESLLDRSADAAEHAIALDPANASAHVALGSVYRDRRDWENSERAYRTALQLDPDDAEAQHQYSEMLANMGRIVEARGHGQRAIELDRAPIRFMNQAAILMSDLEPETALALASEGIALDAAGDVPQLRWIYFRAIAALGRYDEMFTHGSPGLSPAQQDSVAQAFEEEEPDLLPDQFLERIPLAASALDAALGRDDQLVAALERLHREWQFGNFGVLWFPAFDGIRSDPRYLAVLDDLNLEQPTPTRTPRAP